MAECHHQEEKAGTHNINTVIMVINMTDKLGRRVTTTIAILPETKDELEKIGHKGQTYDEILLELIRHRKKHP
jgi:hypothetical protein